MVSAKSRDKRSSPLSRNTGQHSEDDIGFCDLVEDKIMITDDILVKVPHRRIPLHLVRSKSLGFLGFGSYSKIIQPLCFSCRLSSEERWKSITLW